MLYDAGRFAISVLGWRYIPNVLSQQLLPWLHRLYQALTHRRPPAPGTPAYQNHRKWIYTAIVFGYALYTFWNAIVSIGPNYYELLGVHPMTDISGLKNGFRAFAKRHHPDRAGPDSETYFIHVRNAYEALKNPTTRFAYDRFGAEALDWKVITMGEYIQYGLWEIATNYVANVCGVIFWNRLVPRSLAFWNYVLLFGALAMELLFVLSPSPSQSEVSFSSWVFSNPATPSHANLFTLLWPQWVAYQHVNLLRSLTLLLSSALYQVVPNVFPPSSETLDDVSVSKHLATLQTVSKKINQEVVATLHTDLHACHGESTGTTPSVADFYNIQPITIAEPVKLRLQKEVSNMVLEELLLRQNGPLRTACEAAIVRRGRRNMAGHKGSPVERPAMPVKTPSGKADILDGHFAGSGPPLVLDANSVHTRRRSVSF
ncbi:hypothetical protein BC835DRAFT_1287050 [Cytidiella melzeri]|nr:hypothetical protein BC835DRAFT_1287050 [Cytidiella melzeri]